MTRAMYQVELSSCDEYADLVSSLDTPRELAEFAFLKVVSCSSRLA